MMVTIAGVDYYTTAETAKKLQKHIDTIRRWIRDGRLKPKKLGRSYLISEDDILKALYWAD